MQRQILREARRGNAPPNMTFASPNMTFAPPGLI